MNLISKCYFLFIRQIFHCFNLIWMCFTEKKVILRRFKTQKRVKMKTANIYKDIAYNENNPVITVLFETGFTKEIRIMMQKGTVIKEHQTQFPIVIHLMEGTVEVKIDSEETYLKKGDLVALNGSVFHSLKAIEDSIIRLTLTKYDETERIIREIN